MSRVSMISTPDDGSCGIGTYTGELLRAFPDGTTTQWTTVPLQSTNPLPYFLAVFEAVKSGEQVVHVQHEYGIFGPNSIWSWLFFPLLSLLAHLTGTRVVVTLHSAWSPDNVSPPFAGPKRLYVILNNQLLALVADHAIFLSENAADTFTDHTDLRSWEVLPHGVQIETDSLSQAEAKRMFGYDEGTTLVVEPGYIRPEKGSDQFVAIAAECPEIEFLLAGGNQSCDEYETSLRKAATENVQITGSLDERQFKAAFRAADLALLPYREVTQSGILNWCAAYGVPTLGSDTPYFRSLATEWGCVDVVDTEERETAAERVRSLVKDDRKKIRLQKRMHAYRESSSMISVARQHSKRYQWLSNKESTLSSNQKEELRRHLD